MATRKKKDAVELGDTERFALIPLKDMVVFPGMVVPLLVGRSASLAAVEESLAADRFLFLCAQRDPMVEEPNQDELHEVGVVANILQTLRLPDGTIKLVVEGYDRGLLENLYCDRDMYEAEVRGVEILEPQDKVVTALMRSVLNQFEEYVQLSQRIAPEVVVSLRSVKEAGTLCDLVSSYLTVSLEDRQNLLATLEVSERLETLSAVLEREVDLLGIEQQVRERLRDQVEKGQREYYLQEQLKMIHRELGNREDGADEFTELREAIEKAKMPKEAREKAEKELARYERTAPMSPEAAVIRTYIEWLCDMPWKKRTRDSIDIEEAERVLNEDHYGLEKVKERILEFLAVRKLNKKTRGPVLCLVGPPGVGKTSLGKSIARAMNRKFVRVSLGGIRDEAEIRGHRRTYIGSMPGRIIQSLAKVEVNNPVFMLDELDKMTMDFRGDPASALLEVLDPEQSDAFSDHYLEVDFDLQSAFFITTANDEYEIPDALYDRLEVVRLSGYTSLEKYHIAKQYLIPKQVEANGLQPEQISFTKAGIYRLIERYTREAGVRELERKIAAMCRKTARELVSNKRSRPAVISDKRVSDMLGPEEYSDIHAEREPRVGVAIGLAWTMSGGDILHIETSPTPGKGDITLTGSLGEVMRESAMAAFTYLRAHARELSISATALKQSDIHLHVPEGATPKDGPSAGVAIAVSMLSALRKRAPEGALAMSGEITLRGRVLPVGGVKEKSLAAHRAGIKTIILPRENEKDLVEVPKEVKREMAFHFVDDVGEVFALAFPKAVNKKPSKRKKAVAKNRAGK